MQLATATNTVETGNVLASGSFGIAKNGKMFSILSDSMYKDKIGSIVRELHSNARDAHYAAGKPTLAPVIHLPTAFEPWFSVKDFGTGISPDDIFAILCVYGVSTKDQSNDAIGAFGLGAKTPFAYTDNFTVISIFEGMKRMYTAFTGTDGLPELHLQSEEATDESDGFEVIVTVNEKDFDRFGMKVYEQLKFFPVKPELVNDHTGREWPVMDEGIAYGTDEITMYSGGGAPVNGLWVTQGGVGYPVDLDEVVGIDAHTKSFGNAIRGRNAILHFEIGEIAVTAPREALEYTELTINAITSRISNIAKVMCREVMKEIQKEKSVWNRAVIYNSQISVVQTAIRQSPLFDKLFAGMDMDRHNNLAVNMDDLVALGFKAVNMIKFNSYRSNSAGTTIRRKELGNMSHYGDEYLTAAQQVNVFLRDTKKQPMARVKHFVFENDFPLTLVIENKSFGNEPVDASLKGKIAKALRMPVSHINLVSELEVPPREARASGDRAYTAPKAYQWGFRSSTSYSRDWERLYDDIDDIGAAVYVTMDRHDIDCDQDVNLMFAAAEAGELPYDVIAVNRRTAERIQNGKIGADLITPKQAADELRVKMAEVKGIFGKYARDAAFVRTVKESTVVMTMVEKGRMDNLKKQILNMMAKNETNGEIVERYKWMRNHFGNVLYASAAKGEKRAEKIVNDFMARFPMLQYLPTRWGSILEGQALEDALTYIDSLESLDSLEAV